MLRTRPDPALVLGVDLSLVKPGKDGKDDELAARVHDHPQVFTFNKFPSRRRLQPILDRVAADALAIRAAEPTTKPAKPTTKPAKPVAEPTTKPVAKPRAEPITEPEPTARGAAAGSARRRRAT